MNKNYTNISKAVSYNLEDRGNHILFLHELQNAEIIFTCLYFAFATFLKRKLVCSVIPLTFPQ